jgi:hypothetical protein
MRYEINCSEKLAERVNFAARASGVSRTHFTRRVLDAAASAVIEQEARYRAFEHLVQVPLRARTHLRSAGE